MRGIDTILVERGDLGGGTSSRHTGMIHAGTRYVLRDPHAAVECYQENQTLRRIAPDCVVDGGAFFVLIPSDDPEYVPQWMEGCRLAGIPIEEIAVSEVLRAEPAVNPGIQRAFRTPDTTGDPWRLIEANADAARQHGARILTHHRVLSLLEEHGRVVGATCRDEVAGDLVTVRATLVINAAGVWAAEVAGTIGLDVPLLPSKGAMVAFNRRAINQPVARCHLPSDADAMMPSHSVLLSGSTDGDICAPDDISVNPTHVQIVLRESDKILPGISRTRRLRAWSGVRPLFVGGQTSDDTRQITRSHALLDHETRDGKPGLITIVGGKWTTYRLMAQELADLAATKMGVTRPCRTHVEVLPGREVARHTWPGAALSHVEQASEAGELVCECELAPRADLERCIRDYGARTPQDLRRLARVGMGTCQGGTCGYRAAGLLHAQRRPVIRETSADLFAFLQERWRGVVPTADGQHLRQMRLNELIYADLLALDSIR
jgi:glycerol-3-phosphate dehydrogenase